MGCIWPAFIARTILPQLICKHLHVPYFACIALPTVVRGRWRTDGRAGGLGGGGADWRATEVHWFRMLELVVLAIFVGTMYFRLGNDRIAETAAAAFFNMW